jgi:hypothetical protein
MRIQGLASTGANKSGRTTNRREVQPINMEEAQAESSPQQESAERQTGRKGQHPMHKDEKEEEEEDEVRSSLAEGKTGCCLSLLTSGASANLGVARFDGEEGVLELLQLPHDGDCSGLEILCEQLTPEVVVTSSRANYDAADAFHQSLMNLKKSGVEVVYLPAKDFNYDGGLNRLLSIAQEVCASSLVLCNLTEPRDKGSVTDTPVAAKGTETNESRRRSRLTAPRSDRH